jgi:hypothetical protein
MSTYREQALKAKAVRRGIVEPAPAKGGAGKAKGPVVVEYRGKHGAASFLAKEWTKWRPYRDVATAESAMAGLARKYDFWEFRIKP